MDRLLPIQMQDYLQSKSDIINAEVEKGKTSLTSGMLHIEKARAISDRIGAFMDTGKVICDRGRTIEVLEEKVSPDGTMTRRYTRFTEDK